MNIQEIKQQIKDDLYTMDKVQFLKWLLAKLKYTDIEQIEENIDFKGIFDLHAKYHGAYKFGGDRQVQKLKAVSNIFNK